MSNSDSNSPKPRGLVFAGVADAYDRARPSYPEEAARWLTGDGSLTVLELGAGTGKLTEVLVAGGHRVIATDPLPEMLAKLRSRVVPFAVGVSGAEAIPAPTRSIDVVVCAQAFHWFDHAKALPEIARVLRPGGRLSVVWNQRDEGIPWVRKLSRIIGSEHSAEELIAPIEESSLYGEIESAQFRTWQDLNRDGLLDLVRSRSYIAEMEEEERLALLEKVLTLYDDYGRGHAGMHLPYITRCFRATVKHPPEAPPPPPKTEGAGLQTTATEKAGPPEPPEPPEDPDPGTLLIDFR